MDPVLRRLRDEACIKDLVIRFSLAMDARDVHLFRSVWAKEIDLDLQTSAGKAIPLTGRRSADEYSRDVIALLSAFAATQHLSTNHVVAVQGDDATCDCYTTAQHRLVSDAGEMWLSAGSRYHLSGRRVGEDGWQFTGFQLRPIWSRGDTSIWGEAAKRLGQEL